MTKIERIAIADIELNNGQIPGLPDNPRCTTPESIQQTIDSINQDPEMLELRGLLVYPYNGKYITIGGNTRLQALRQMNYDVVPCVIIPETTPVDALKRYIVKDNASFGQWNWDKLTSGWNVSDLESWAIEIPSFQHEQEDESNKRPGWNSGKDATESLCDMNENIALHERSNISFVSCYKKSDSGFPLSQIKSDGRNIKVFADMAANVIRKCLGLRTPGNWCIITTPKRRHKECNFASMVAKQIASIIGIPFHDDVISAKNRHRINPTFTLEYHFGESNVIVFDDILTTGSTIVATDKCLNDKNCFYIIGINNN